MGGGYLPHPTLPHNTITTPYKTLNNIMEFSIKEIENEINHIPVVVAVISLVVRILESSVMNSEC